MLSSNKVDTALAEEQWPFSSLLGAICVLNAHICQEEILLNEVQSEIMHSHKPLSVFVEK